MAGSDRPEWPPRSSRPGDHGGAGDERFDFDYGVLDDVPPPPRRQVPGPDRGPRPERGPRPDRPQRRDSGDKQPAAKAKPKSAHSKGNLLWRWRRGFFVLALVGMAAVAAGVSTVAQTELPEWEVMQQSSFICSSDIPDGECNNNNYLVKLAPDQEEDRDYVSLEKIPQVVRDAVIATEDREFYEHKGIDPMGIGRALYRDLRGGGLSQGGSTITQQLVKNAFLNTDRTAARKIKEAVLAMKLEQQMSKDDILERYLNEIYFGRNAYGIQAASLAYFNKPIQDVLLGEASYLAGLIRSPGAADAREHPEEATRRRTTTLNAMVEEGYITEAEADIVEAVNLTDYVVPRATYQREVTRWGGSYAGIEYVTEFVQQQVEETLTAEFGEERAEELISRGGLRISTTLNQTMQQQAYDAVYVENLDDPVGDPASGLVAIDNQGFIRAMVGGRDYNAPQSLETRADDATQVNFAVSGLGSSGRGVGSTFKPIALAAALRDDNASMERTAIRAPGEMLIEAGDGNPCDPWTVHNYASENTEEGNLNLVQATAKSSNTAFAQIIKAVSVERVQAMAKDLGMDSELADCLPIVLGSDNSTPLEMAEVYSTFANRGVHIEPTIITRIDRVDDSGDSATLWTAPSVESRSTPVLTQQQADLITYALQGVITGGTGTGADIGKDAAGKTGTTSNNVDSWFIGYVPTLTTAVWVGYPVADVPITEGDIPIEEGGIQKVGANGDPLWQLPTMNNDDVTGRPVRGLRSVTGGSIPADIWSTFMSTATEGVDDEFVDPTPEQLKQGTPLLGETYQEAPATTVPPEDDDDPDIPDLTLPTMPTTPTSTPSSSTPTSTPTTIWPPTTGPGRPGGGGGDGAATNTGSG